MTGDDPVRLEDVHRAHGRIAEALYRTPMLTCRSIGERFGIRLHLKAELFQRTGSFKPRGILNRVRSLSVEELRRGLVTISAGNAAAAAAWCARREGTRAVVVMPERASRSKVAATEGYGGHVVLTARPLLEVLEEVREREGLTFVHPFDDPRVMAGHGTIALEMHEDVPDLDVVLVPVGGGGLIGGIAAAYRALRPQVRVIGVEPVGAAVMSRSLEQGSPVTLETWDTVADGLAAPFAGRHTFAEVRRHVERIVTVEDAAIEESLRLLATRAKLAAEPSGAAGLAPLVAGLLTLPADTSVGVVVCGGNVDADVLARILAGPDGLR